MLTQEQIRSYAEGADREAAAEEARGNVDNAQAFRAVAARWRAQLVGAAPAAPAPVDAPAAQEAGHVAPSPEGAPLSPRELGYTGWSPAPPVPRMFAPPMVEDGAIVFELPPVLVPWARAARRVERRAPPPASGRAAAAVVPEPSRLRKAGAVAVPLGILAAGALVRRRVSR